MSGSAAVAGRESGCGEIARASLCFEGKGMMLVSPKSASQCHECHEDLEHHGHPAIRDMNTHPAYTAVCMVNDLALLNLLGVAEESGLRWCFG
jgi:hypothetical protein